MDLSLEKFVENEGVSYGDGENLLIFDDNLSALEILNNSYKGKIKCVCIDPPFNTQTFFSHFQDKFSENKWLEMMRRRLNLLRSLMQEDGSIWIIIDDSQLYSLKLLCDKIFSKNNFQANIIWNHSITSWKGYKGQFQYYHVYILVYSKSQKFILKPLSETRKKPETVWKARNAGGLKEAFQESINLFGKKNKFSTPKPERLIYRILDVATDPDDLVLDIFAGSGTTGAVAHKMRRRWIMIEKGQQCQTHILPRLRKVVDGVDPNGITTKVCWKGGGGFRYLCNLAGFVHDNSLIQHREREAAF